MQPQQTAPIDSLMPLLINLKDVFRGAERGGAEVDMPEGTRYILISDTMANMFARKIEEFQLAMNWDRKDRVIQPATMENL